MDIQITMHSGAQYDGKIGKFTGGIPELCKILNNTKEDFIILDRLRGSEIINKRNILSVRKK